MAEFNDPIEIKGHISIKLFGPNGEMKTCRELHNVITTVGKNYLADWLIQATQADYFMRYIALGTGVNAAQASDTTLQTEIGTRVAGVLSSNTNIWSNQATFGPGNATGTITEAGVFSANAAGTMVARNVFTAVGKDAGDSLQITWSITLS